MYTDLTKQKLIKEQVNFYTVLRIRRQSLKILSFLKRDNYFYM